MTSVSLPFRDPDRDRGAAVVEFTLVAILVITLFMAVLQVAIYVHVRNVVVASAQEGARYAANADVDSSAGAARTKELVAQSLSQSTADGLSCSSGEQAGEGGTVLVVVECTGAVPTLIEALGALLPIEIRGRAVKEGVTE